MKFTAGLILAALAIAGATSEPTQTLKIDPNSPTHFDPAMISGLGPQVPAGNNPKLKKAMESLAGSHHSGSGDYYTIEPSALTTENPAYINGLGPQKPFKDHHRQLKEGNTNTMTIDPKSMSTESPSTIGGLGPQTPAGDNPKTKNAMKSLAGSHGSSSEDYYTIDPATLPHLSPGMISGLGPMVPAENNPKLKKTMGSSAKKEDGSTTTFYPSATTTPKLNPAMYEGLGPVVLPGSKDYGKNPKFNEAWKEFQGASSSGSVASNCAQVCPDVYDPVYGTDGVKYSNSCFLGIASCKNPEKHIAKASDDGNSKQTTQS